MTEEKFSIILSMVIPPAIAMIIEQKGWTEKDAITAFYHSKVYSALAQEDLKTWHYGPATLCDMFMTELETGDFLWPEEAC